MIGINYIKSILQEGTIEADITYANLVVVNNPIAVKHFLNQYSMPFLKYIGREIVRVSPVILISGEADYTLPIMGEYYEFISAPNINGIPGWRKLFLYEGKNGSRLYSYVSTITLRYFISVQSRRKKQSSILTSFYEGEKIESVEMEVLMDYNGFERDKIMHQSDEMRNAWQKLPERDQKVLECLVVDGISGLEAFQLLSPYLNPKLNIPIDDWTTKQKQDAMALLKQRAKKHLRQLIIVERQKNRK